MMAYRSDADTFQMKRKLGQPGKSGAAGGVFRCLPVAALALALNAHSAVPGGSDASRFGERFTPQQAPLSQPVSGPVVPGTHSESAPPGAEDIRFVLKQVVVEQATAFSREQLAEQYAGYLDTEISLADVYLITDRITALYDSSGYLLSRAIVPPQTIDDGSITLRVVEGYIDDVKFEGLPPGRDAFFQHYREQVLNSRPLHRDVLERYLLLANDLPGLRFKAVLRPSVTTPGATTLYLKAETAKWRGSVSLDNRGARTSGPWQLVAEGQVFGLLDPLDSTGVRLATNPVDVSELKYLYLSHERVVSPEGWTLNGGFTLSSTEPGDDALRLLDTNSRYRNLGLGVSYPMIRSRERNLVLNGGLAWLNSETDQLGGRVSVDRLRLLTLGGSYDQSDSFLGGGISLLSLTLTRGMNVFNAESTSRALAGPRFTHLKGLMRRNQVLTGRLGALLRLGGQVSNGPLPSTEQYGLGGEYSVRGYEPSEWTGDRGFAGTAELTYRPELEITDNLQVYGFADFGKVWRKSALAGEDRSNDAGSTGFGVRHSFPGEVGLNLEAVRQLDRDSRGDSPGWVGYVRVSVGF